MSIIEKIDGLFTQGMINGLFSILIIFIIAYALDQGAKRMIDAYAKKVNRRSDMFFIFFKKIVRVLIYTISFIAASQEIIPLKNLGTAILGVSGAFTVIIALGTQEVAENLVAGVVLSIYEPFKKGDLVKLVSENIVGEIEDLNLRHCTIRTLENTKLIVPNKVLNNAIVENRAANVGDPHCNFIYYSIAYDADFEKAKKIIQAFISESKEVVNPEDSDVIVHELKDTYVEIRVKVFSKTALGGIQLKAQMNEYILNEFAKHNIEIPYPYLNVVQK